MRKLAVGAGVVVALVLVPQPAEGKCFSVRSVAVRGVASAPPLVLSSEQWERPRNENSPTAVVIEGLLGRSPMQADPPHRLGPRYRVLYFLEVADFRSDRTRGALLEQDVYLETSAGPMTFTPPQRWVSCTGQTQNVGPGWQPFPAELVKKLRSFGLPPPVGAPNAEVEAGGMPWGWASLAAAAIVIAGVGATASTVASRRPQRDRLR